MRKARTRDFRETIERVAETDGVWRMSRWGRGGLQDSYMPKLASPGSATSASDLESKAAVLRRRFYPTLAADLSDISDQTFGEETFTTRLEMKRTTCFKEMRGVLSRKPPYNAPGPDTIPTGFLRAMGAPLEYALASLAEACWMLEYHPTAFKRARTVTLRKPKKASYQEASAWRPIALLCTMGKAIEALTASRIRELAEDNGWLPKEQMGGRAGRSTETALELLTTQVRTAWDCKKVATLLSMDISGAFDTVNHIRLLDTLRSKGLPGWAVRWVRSFLSDRTSTLVINGEESALFSVTSGVPQGSPLSPILFMLYNSELFDICRAPHRGISSVGFADDLNVLAYGDSTAANCKELEQVHEKCLQWAARFGMAFAPNKYELIHFSTATKRFDMAQPIHLGEVSKDPTASVRVLGVWFDPKLKWTAHARAIKEKMSTQLGGLTRIASSTWGATFSRARLIYSRVIRVGMSYAAPVWHRFGDKESRVAKELQKVQNKALRTVLGAYKATPISSLEVEADVPPLSLYLDSRCYRTHSKAESTRVKREIRRAARAIRLRCCRRASAPIKDSAVKENFEWTKRYEENVKRLKQAFDEQAAANTPLPRRKGRRKKKEEPAFDPLNAIWHEKWSLSQRTPRWDRVSSPPCEHLLTYARRNGLNRASNSVLTQLRTGCIGLGYFLSKRRVPGASKSCECDELSKDTPRHLLTECTQHGLKPWDAPERQRGFWELLSNPAAAKEVTEWVIKSGRLPQFDLAKELYYGGAGGNGPAARAARR